MKKSALSLIIIMTAFISQSQILVQENKMWNIIECLNFGGCFTTSYKISGDTILNDIEYKKLLITSDSTYTDWGFFGGIREENEIVYVIRDYFEDERVLYDFSLSIGDTFSGISPHYDDCTFELELLSIDTITLINGEQRQRFDMGGEYWIKGIGSTMGLTNIGLYFCVYDIFWVLSCNHENDTLVYQAPYQDECYVYTVSIEEKAESKTIVFPNPFLEVTSINFNYDRSKSYTFQVFDYSSSLVLNDENISSGEIKINLRGFSNGMYYYRILSGNKEIAKGKLHKIDY